MMKGDGVVRDSSGLGYRRGGTKDNEAMRVGVQRGHVCVSVWSLIVGPVRRKYDLDGIL